MVLYKLLASGCKGRSLAMVRLQKNWSGLTVWAAMAKEYAPEDAYHQNALLRKIMQPLFTQELFLQQSQAWENQISEYELSSGMPVPEPMRCAILSGSAPANVKTFLKFSTGDLTTSCLGLRSAILDSFIEVACWKLQHNLFQCLSNQCLIHKGLSLKLM